MHRVVERAGEVPLGKWTEAFAAALDDDLAVPKALAEIHNVVTEGNKALSGNDIDTATDAAGQVRAMLGILGLDPLDPHRDQRADTTDTVHHALDVLVTEQLQQRGATPCHSAKVFVSQS